MKTTSLKSFTLFPGMLALWPAAASAQTFTNLHNFTGAPYAFPIGFPAGGDGASPTAGLFLQGNILYGTTENGGSPGGKGTTFGINANGTGYAMLGVFGAANSYGNSYGVGPPPTYFTDPNGAYPVGGLTAGGIGTTKLGLYGFGTVFGGNGSYQIYQFSNSFVGANPEGTLASASGGPDGHILYGTASAGGAGGRGTAFRIDYSLFIVPPYQEWATASLTVLHPFGGGSDGAYPAAGLVLSGDTLYGTASGDSYGNGSTVFKVGTNGMNFATLYNFTNGIDGAYPVSDLVLSGNTLYGTAKFGGSAGNGTVFKVNTDGSGFAPLYSFSAMSGSPATNSDGADPVAGLVLSHNILFGTASAGGTGGNGTIFRINTDGTGFTTLYNFTPVFTNRVYAALTNADGANPAGDLLLSSNVLYGTAENGGTSGLGTVFALSVPPIAVSLPLNIQLAGDSVVLTWTNTGVSLQSAPGVQPVNSGFTNITGATSPYTNPITGSEMFFRLNPD
jgi:uncharacterized repeat protein (TIGR03803 family)